MARRSPTYRLLPAAMQKLCGCKLARAGRQIWIVQMAKAELYQAGRRNTGSRFSPDRFKNPV